MSSFGTPLDDVFVERLGDLLDGTAECANTLARLAYLQIAKAHPGNPTMAERTQIKADSTHPSDVDINMRSLSPDGIALAVFLSTCLLNEMVAHSAPAYVAEAEAHDESLLPEVFDDIRKRLEAVCKKGVKNGISPYGMTAVAINHSVDFALRHNVHPVQIVRPLKQCLDMTNTDFMEQSQKKPSKDELLSGFAARFGVTKATAKKYLNQCKAK